MLWDPAYNSRTYLSKHSKQHKNSFFNKPLSILDLFYKGSIWNTNLIIAPLAQNPSVFPFAFSIKLKRSNRAHKILREQALLCSCILFSHFSISGVLCSILQHAQGFYFLYLGHSSWMDHSCLLAWIYSSNYLLPLLPWVSHLGWVCW